MDKPKSNGSPKVNEFKSMKACIGSLEKLDKSRRERVLNYLVKYFSDDTIEPMDLSDLDDTVEN